ncbi:LIM-type domain-containing protein, partial [Sarcoptes scabiei]
MSDRSNEIDQNNRPGLNKKSLFIVALIASILFNVWIQWNKPFEQRQAIGLEEIGQKIDTVRAKVKKLLDIQQKIQSNRFGNKKSEENIKSISIRKLLEMARKEKYEIFFTSNENKITEIIEVAKNIITIEFPSCQQDYHPNKFDIYRNCFRSLSIEFHNRLSMRFQSHWFTMIGRSHYSFMITTIQSKRNEYLFRIGEIFFQTIEYENLLTSSQIDEYI